MAPGLPFAALLSLGLSACLPAQQAANVSGGPLIPEEGCYDVQHYDLRLRVDPDKQEIHGSLAMTAKVTTAARKIALDLDEHLEVGRLELDGEPIRGKHAEGRIWITLPRKREAGESFVVTVHYGGRPRVAPNPPWDGGFTWKRTPEGGAPWIATSCQGGGGDLWWPCKDHPSDKPETMDLRITVPGDLFCASNGVLQSDTRHADGTRTLHWRLTNPISNYCVALNIAPYEAVEVDCESVTGETFPAVFYVLPEDLEKGREAFPKFLEHLRFMEEVCGPYPFRAEKYGLVETPHLGMEHQTIVAYGNHFQVDPDGYDWLHHHEMSHEWWANLVTCRDWKDMWIHEGIGTYMQALYLERLRGQEGYKAEMAAKRASIRNRRPIAPREVQNSKEIYFGVRGEKDSDIYFKGSWVCHTLRWYLGDEVFFQVLRRWAYPDPALEQVTDGRQVRFTDTEELRSIAEKVSGRDLGWFFEVYLRQAELPELLDRRSGGRLRLEWRAPGGLDFPMPVAVRIGADTVRVEMPGGKGEVDLPRGAEVQVDPDLRILKK